MARERALKLVLLVVGVLFTLAAYPVTVFFSREPSLAMMLSIYTTLGIFLLIASRNPSGHRSLIAFTAWSSFAHAVLMGTQVLRNVVERREFIGVVVFVVIGIVLLVLAPPKAGEQITAARA